MVQTITLGGGCFWCVEAAFQPIDGVKKVTSGYTGGHVVNPTYKQVCGGDSGHAEVVQVEYDPSKAPFEKIMKVFFTVHDPTQLNRQGNDTGTQYRSSIFYETEDQKKGAEEYIKQLQSYYKVPIVTEISKLGIFYPAEDYHQDYYRKNPNQGYCSYIIRPKILKLEKEGLTK
mmetsp:Transcript_13716/g.22655  ORF Transcript_13716/g.22655 Transcript_13716/m.22655 type:complete len:173 (-) Transcript_13716:430-948(-)|eukprot:CAMPEP_0184657296 /NCGR_PEP_ID=MMETSP0308-20130426/18413_1 /TAXON_ID=38269 /ORGANISM="Gloeochaete witrockiana, Strain SAG 46.84" /LENGTH=172 /DNA_ID=CAMNT_0027094963 /DNA_START=135 /DNA_END=653 /DNA_ORIENTATION=-